MTSIPDQLVVAAARRWRDARNEDRPVLRALHILLQPRGYDMLGPAFDSLMRLCESRFDHRICTGCRLAPTADEHLLCRLLADPSLLDRVPACRAGEGMDRAFRSALQSMRILLADLQSEPAIDRETLQ